MNRYYRTRCSSHMNARYLFTNGHQMFPLSSMGTCQVWWFMKVWASLALFDGIIETISMAFSRNIFQAFSHAYQSLSRETAIAPILLNYFLSNVFMQIIRMLFCSICIASFAHERIRHMVMSFSRHSVFTAKNAVNVEPIKYLGKKITSCLTPFCAKEALCSWPEIRNVK